MYTFTLRVVGMHMPYPKKSHSHTVILYNDTLILNFLQVWRTTQLALHIEHLIRNRHLSEDGDDTWRYLSSCLGCIANDLCLEGLADSEEGRCAPKTWLTDSRLRKALKCGSEFARLPHHFPRFFFPANRAVSFLFREEGKLSIWRWFVHTGFWGWINRWVALEMW